MVKISQNRDVAPLNRTHKENWIPEVQTLEPMQAHHQKMHAMPGGLKLCTNKKACFGHCFG